MIVSKELNFIFVKFLQKKNPKYLDGLIKYIYSIEKRRQKNAVKIVMHYSPRATEKSYGTERGFPSDEKFVKSGWYKQMIKRYLFTGWYFCKTMDVLDTCCGTGWGSYIISKYAKKIDAYDISETQIEENKKEWKKYTNKINWFVSDALHFKQTKQYNVVLAMESLEHFTKEEGKKYVKSLYDCISSSGGILAGSTPIIESEEAALRNKKDNPYHLHIYKEKELKELLAEYFDDVIIHKHKGIGFFFAIKK